MKPRLEANTPSAEVIYGNVCLNSNKRIKMNTHHGNNVSNYLWTTLQIHFIGISASTRACLGRSRVWQPTMTAKPSRHTLTSGDWCDLYTHKHTSMHTLIHSVTQTHTHTLTNTFTHTYKRNKKAAISRKSWKQKFPNATRDYAVL